MSVVYLPSGIRDSQKSACAPWHTVSLDDAQASSTAAVHARSAHSAQKPATSAMERPTVFVSLLHEGKNASSVEPSTSIAEVRNMGAHSGQNLRRDKFLAYLGVSASIC